MRKKTKRIQNEKGTALLESVVFLMAFLTLTAYIVDFFAAVHTGIVNSIHARTYLFETLQHRTDIGLLRQAPESPANPDQQVPAFNFSRFHSVSEEFLNGAQNLHPSGRNLTQVSESDRTSGNQNGSQSTSTIYVRTGYGICVDSRCSLVEGGI